MRKAQRNETPPDAPRQEGAAAEGEDLLETEPRSPGGTKKGKKKKKKKRGEGGGLFSAWGSSASSAAIAVADSADSAVKWMEEADAEKRAKEAAEVAALEDVVVSDHGPVQVDCRMCQLSSAAATLKALSAPPFNTDLASIRCGALFLPPSLPCRGVTCTMCLAGNLTFLLTT